MTNLCQLDLLGHLGRELGRVVNLAKEFAAVTFRAADAVCRKVKDALERAAHADGPTHRHNVQRQSVGHFIQRLERRAALAVHLVDECDDRYGTHAANLEQLARLRLDTLCRVDHHDSGIDGGERAIGVFREVLVARCVEQVEGDPVPLEGHD